LITQTRNNTREKLSSAEIRSSMKMFWATYRT